MAMRSHAQTIIIGAGIVGVSAAYHLARGGLKDIVVLDRGPLFQTGGSTSHAPGGIFQNNTSRTVSKLAQWSVEMFHELSDEANPTYFPTGSLEVATTETRWVDLHRKYGYARSWGLDARLLSPAETVEKFPLIDQGTVRGSIFVERDGMVRSVPTVTRLARRAVALGVEFIGETMVTEFEHRNGHVHTVLTDRGPITSEQVLLCGGIWGPELGRMAGIQIPLQPCAHPFVRTTPMPELAGLENMVYPLWRHQDFSMYLWQDGERMGVGSYRHEPVIVDASEICNDAPAPADLPFDESVFAPARAEAERLVPALTGTDDTDRVYGMFSFTPDGHSLIGESSDVRGLWVAEAVWVTHGIGAGRAVADLMLTGDCELDLREMDLNRFAAHAGARSFVRERGRTQYREVYDIIHPRAEFTAPRGLRRSPSYEQQKALGAVFTESNGWERPLWYDANATLSLPAFGTVRDAWAARRWSPIAGAEHLAVRSAAGLFDLSTFTRIDLTGPGALDFLGQQSCTNLDRTPMRAIYALFLNQHGGVESDMTIARLAGDRFLLLAGPASGPRDLARLKRAAGDRADVRISDVTSGGTALGLWGPNARTILVSLVQEERGELDIPAFGIREIFVAGIPCLAIHMSYVGEDGFELHCPTEYGAALWEAIWQAGQEHGLVAAGLHAMDSLRLERGRLGLGTDLLADRTPYEAGVGFAVSSKRSDYIGKQALDGSRPSYTLATIALDDPSMSLLGKEPVLLDGQIAGFVTSANTAWSTGQSLALAYLPADRANVGTPVETEYFGARLPGRVVESPVVASKTVQQSPVASKR
jgi:glycine cleavage system aminomethyltransferase T/glycine/D-amino acid oxidase-like deaminating enzyme